MMELSDQRLRIILDVDLLEEAKHVTHFPSLSPQFVLHSRPLIGLGPNIRLNLQGNQALSEKRFKRARNHEEPDFHKASKSTRKEV